MARPPNRSRQTRALLAALLEGAAEWHYGYVLAKRLGIGSGTLYPLLARLRDQGLLEAKWEDAMPGKPPRHVYRITGEGRKLALEQREEPGRPAVRVAPA